MEEFKKLPLWKTAYAVGKEVRQLTENLSSHNSIFLTLREKSESLPVAIAVSTMETGNAAYVGSLRTVYDEAHDIEYLLFLSLLLRDLRDEQTRRLVHRLHAMKRGIVVQISNLNTGR